MFRVTRRGEVPDFAPATVISTKFLFYFNSYQTLGLVMGSYQTLCLGTNLTLRAYQNYHFHIVSCPKMIENAWEGVTKRALTSAWKKLWPESFVECDIEESEIMLCGAYSQ
ncbi:hypothetical protein AVEN_274093-1 [Araneus ventricosus]|uniref:DDE-1 domain-containing protein n=1 Tax=Araneus ventricosus TaxID=182803 RepID=A0A4Y2ANE4_ARAVE|nr:hypothetical protein AVEN_274093-1 [Araneus ventricosus]